MENKTQQAPPQGEDKKGNKPRYVSRRERRASYRTVYNNNRKPKNQGFLQMGTAWDGSAMFAPKRKKLKGYQKNQKR